MSACLTCSLLIAGTLSALHCAPSNTPIPAAAPPTSTQPGSGPSGGQAPGVPVAPAPSGSGAPIFAGAPARADTASAVPGASLAPPDDARGGRLFDNWRAERGTNTFTPDSSKTPDPDGSGGPNGNGTLNDGRGKALLNTGHDYRLKNLFGWDLRGADGVYGPAYQNKAYVLGRNLLVDGRSPGEIRRWLAEGDEHTPAYGQVLDEKDLADLTAFVVKTRDAALARPDHVYRLEAQTPKNYTLIAGADPAAGRRRFAQTCSECHGQDGRELAIDDTESVGTLARSSAYEIWFKIQHGHPGSPMKRQVSEASGAENGRAVLDILAALCDRSAFPALAGKTSADVSDGDPRCGAYLK